MITEVSTSITLTLTPKEAEELRVVLKRYEYLSLGDMVPDIRIESQILVALECLNADTL